MSKIPPISPEQRTFTADKARDRLRSAEPDRRDEDTSQETPGGGADIRRIAQQQGR